jgi:protein involved in polysaccharide export with SLBB domain
MWGAYEFSGTLTIDAQGNIFIPNVGPIHVAGISNGQLQTLMEQQIRRVYRANVGIYAALEQAQPIKVYVTGFVSQPGNYGGVSNDSVLAYLDRAGGVDTQSGSYVDVEIRRTGRIVQQVNLYDFLLSGSLQPFNFKNGDVIVVSPRKQSFDVKGEVYNAYTFEFDKPNLTVQQALTVARMKPTATHISINRRQGTEYRSEYFPISQAGSIILNDGDQLMVTADRYQGTIQVRIEGAHAGEHAIVLPYGATLDQVLNQIKANQLSEIGSIQLFRKSVAERQKEMLNLSLDKLEESTYSVRSATNEEASLRIKDAELIQKFVDRARQIQPQGQVVLTNQRPDQIILENGDILKVPEKTSVIMMHGEVMFPNAIAWQQGLTVSAYVQKVGGYTQDSDKSKIIVIKPSGEADLVKADHIIQQGDQIMILPKVSTKRVEVARGVSQILYQIAIAAKVVFGL